MEEKTRREEEYRKDYKFYFGRKRKKKNNIFRWSRKRFFQMATDIVVK